LGRCTNATAAGLDPATPAVAVVRATRPDECSLVSTIAGLPDRVAAASLPGPVIVMVGRTFANLAIAKVDRDTERQAVP
jgi:uroporphyrin-III C-methyltransferase/precorrin-2 dehydrogenase/sirohydrochlorin ferrochelatase